MSVTHIDKLGLHLQSSIINTKFKVNFKGLYQDTQLKKVKSQKDILLVHIIYTADLDIYLFTFSN